MHVALTIAGSDSGGGAGIQADLKTFHQHGLFGTSAITAVTAQNTLGVTRWEAVSVDLVKAQIDAVAEDLRPLAVKSGMLANAAIVESVASALEHHRLGNYVLDPVMVATSGDMLIEPDAVEALRDRLLPLAALVTPNAGEAAVLAGYRVSDEASMRRAARSIFDLGAKAVLIKGGHVDGASGGNVIDILYDGAFETFRHPRLATTSTHGTGCTLSAAIAAHLARGADLAEAVTHGIDYVHAALASAPRLGAGNGPLNHFVRGSFLTNSVTSD